MSFKPITLNATTSFVSSLDPAIDWDAIAAREVEATPEIAQVASPDARRTKALETFAERFARESFRNPSSAEKALLFKSGMQPTRFVLGAITAEDMARIADECGGKKSTSQLQWRAFLASLRDVENFVGEVPKLRTGEASRVDPAWVSATFVRGLHRVALGVGLVAWSWNQLTDDEAKN